MANDATVAVIERLIDDERRHIAYHRGVKRGLTRALQIATGKVLVRRGGRRPVRLRVVGQD